MRWPIREALQPPRHASEKFVREFAQANTTGAGRWTFAPVLALAMPVTMAAMAKGFEGEEGGFGCEGLLGDETGSFSKGCGKLANGRLLDNGV